MEKKKNSGKNDLKKAVYSIFIFMMVTVFLGISGCMRIKESEKEKHREKANRKEEIQPVKIDEKIQKDSERLAEGYRTLYSEAEQEGRLDTVEFQQKVVSYLGKAGYSSIDMNNQINMTNAKSVETFCKAVKTGKKELVTILAVLDQGGFVRYDLTTENGKIYAKESALNWKDRRPIVDYYHEFEVYDWKYTEKGYLFLEEYHPPGYDGATGDIGFRVKPLDWECRELNRRYVLSLGYELNNLLITDWGTADYENLDLYDLFEQMYVMKYGEMLPYRAEEGIEYQIPAAAFEEVLQTFLPMNQTEIREQTIYEEQNQTYRYRPRGIYDCEFPFVPYPEVTSWEESETGELKLTVEAVWIKEKTDRAIVSELVVKPLEDGKLQYISNQVIERNVESERDGTAEEETSQKRGRAPWYTPRLTEEEWEKYYRTK